MARWTDAQDDSLRDNFNARGAAWCAYLMRRMFGVTRTEQAVAREAYRLGLSVKPVCPECGETSKLNKRTGLCPLCNERAKLKRQRDINAELADALRKADELEAMRRENARLRKANQRARERLGR